MKGVRFSQGKKFDGQLEQAVIREQNLGRIFTTGIFELKSESWLWERTGNICVEYRWRGEPSGIAVTSAEVWIHELVRDGVTLVWMMFPIERLKELAAKAYREKRYKKGVGDDDLSDVVIIPLKWIIE